MRHVNIIDKELEDKFSYINMTTGEIPRDEEEAEKTFRLTRKTFKKLGCKYEFNLRKYQFAQVVNEYLVINLHSKMRGSAMLCGIDESGLKQIYEDLMEFEIAYFDYDTFLNRSRVTDADFYLDYKCVEDEYKKFIQKIKTLTPMTKERDRGFKSYFGGIEWNTRSGADNSNPYMKCYNKELEMRNRFGKYLHHYVTEDELENRRRFEFTIKDAFHFQSLGIRDFSLKSIVDIEQSHLERMMKEIATKNLKLSAPVIAEIEEEQDLRPKQILYLKTMQYLHQKGESFDEMVEYLTRTMDKKSRYAYKKQLEMLYCRFINNVDIRDVFKGNNPVFELIMAAN